MKVAVLGCGPAGLMAAQAAADADAEVIIYSKARKSHMFGAQYLHRVIPGITDIDNCVSVDYLLQGSVDEYRRKVYGPMWDGKVSPEDFAGTHHAWDIREAYDRLWEIWEGRIEDVTIDPAGLHNLSGYGFDAIINSVPLDSLCPMGHTFGFTTIIAAGDAPELGIKLPYYCPDNTVICNGDDAPSWYRLSNIYGYKTVEWSADIGRVPIPSASTVRKPTFTNCDCHPGVIRVGRYGTWSKGVLSHQAYYDVKDALR